MTIDQWKSLLASDRRAAIRALFRVEYQLDNDFEDPIFYTPDDLVLDIEKLHTGTLVPYHTLPNEELIKKAEAAFEDEDKPDPPPEEIELEVTYRCPKCDTVWHEEKDTACDSECPNCETENITALSWKEIE